jgi:hypothetical protein
MGSSAPKPTSPRDMAGAATGTNIGTAVANTWLGNMSENTPYGSTSVTQSGSQSYTDPYTGQTYNIPTFTRNTSLSPTQQGIFDASQGAALNTANAAKSASGNLGSMFSQPVNLNGAPQPGVPTLQDSYITDFSADRTKVEDALFSRLNPQLERDRASLETSLANKGVKLGSAAYDRAMTDFGQTTNDARMQAILAGGQEQSRLAGLARDAAMFGNQAKTGQYGLTAGERARQMEEQFALRNQSLSEAQGLMGMGQPSMPSFMGGNAGQIAPTNVAGLMSQYDQQRMQQWQQKQQNMGGLMGGIGGLIGML